MLALPTLPTLLAVAVALGAAGSDAGPSPERATSDGGVPGAATRAVALGGTDVDAWPTPARAETEPGAFAAASADAGPSPERATSDGGVPGAPTRAVVLGGPGVDAWPSPERAADEPRALAPLDAGPSPERAMDDAGTRASPADAATDVAATVSAPDAGTCSPSGDAEPSLRFRVWGATTAGWDGQQQIEIVTMHAVAHVRAGIEAGWGPLRARAVISLLTTARQRSEAWAAPQAADLGSHVELAWTPAAGHTIALQFFPFDSSVVLPSFDWAQAWGRASPAAPLGRLSYEGPRFGAWAALRQGQPLPVGGDPGLDRGLDVLGGARLTLGELRVEVRGARIERPTSAVTSPIVDVGAVARVTWLHGGDPGTPIDFVTWGTDPTRFERLLAPRPPEGPDGVAVTVGGGAGSRSVALPSDQSALRTVDAPWWLEASVRARRSALRLFAYLRARSVTAALLDGPYFSALVQATAPPVERHVGLSAVAGFDWTVSRWRLTPGLLVRVWQDAAYQPPRFDFGGLNPPPGLTPPRWLIVDDDWRPRMLPQAPTVAVAVKATLRLELADAVTLAAEADVAHDPKFWAFLDSTDTINVTQQLSPWVVTGTILLQARTP